MKLHLFDFDGTISNSDSMFEFLKMIYNKSSFYFLIIKSLPIFIKYHLGIISKDNFKEMFLINFLSKFSKNFLTLNAKIFVKNYEGNLKKSALKYIKNLKKDKENEITIVSASLDIWITPIAKNLGINSISTVSNFNNNSFSGIKGKNCWGKEKVSRIQTIYDLKEYSEIYAYGDSSGDFEMLKIANHKMYRFFN